MAHSCWCSVNELEGTVGIRIPPTTSPVTTGTRERPARPLRTVPHCHTLAPGGVVPTTLRDIGSISTPDTQHYSVTINSYLVDTASSYMLVSNIKPCMYNYIPLHPTSRSDPSQSVQFQLHARRVSGMLSASNAFRSMLPPVSVDPNESLPLRSTSPSEGSSLLGVAYDTVSTIGY